MARLTDRAQNDLKCVKGPLKRNQTKPNLHLVIGQNSSISSRDYEQKQHSDVNQGL